MNKSQKLEYQAEVEQYLEENKIYEFFENLTKKLIVNKPEDPINFLIDDLKKPEKKIVFLIGPPGSNSREFSLDLADYLKFTCLSVGDLLKKEVSKKSELGTQIETEIKQFKYVSDNLVIQTVFEEIIRWEQDDKSLILEGFPKTKIQALALQRKGIFPDSFVILNAPKEKVQKACEFSNQKEINLRMIKKVFIRIQKTYNLNKLHKNINWNTRCFSFKQKFKVIAIII